MHTTNTQSNRPPDSSVFPMRQNITRQSMSSREISDLLNSRHDKVKQSIDRLVQRGTIIQPPMGDEQNNDSLGRSRTESVYHLCKRDSFVVVAQLSPEFTARLVDRWQELEDQAAGRLRLPANYAEALQVAADQAKESQRLQSLVDHQAPKVAAINRLAAAGGSICISDAAKHLQVSPNQLFAWLEAHRWIFHRGGSKRWTAYQPRITKGFMVHKVTELKPDAETGADRAAYQPLITPKGLTYLAEKNIGAAQ
ncbi:MAG: phage antirepressor KilAC domain-containing protein [Janthinobacterium lividum]